MAAVEAAKAAGVEVTCEATPHHLTLTDEEVRSLDSRFKMNPPLRTEDDRQALIEGSAPGSIDCIATDHAPHASDEKEVPFEEAAMGVTGLETAFAVALHRPRPPGRARPRRPSSSGWRAGAEPLRLRAAADRARRRGEPRPVDLDAEWEAGAEGWESRSDNSCFAGRRLRGRVLMTVAAGRVAYRQRRFAMGVA